MSSPDARHRRNGFATVFAVALIALVGIALTAMAAVMHVEVRQSIAANADVQIRQMLLAGEHFARAAIANDPQAHEANVPLPDALKQDNGRLTIDVQPAVEMHVDVTIQATYGTFVRSQILRFAKENERWNLSEATLLPLQRAGAVRDHTSD